MPDVMKTVGRYEILRELGHGGMATVFLARQSDLERFVALKRMSVTERSDPSLARRFVRESRMAGSLSHPNIVTVHDYFEHEGTAYIAMEYVERGSLRPYVGSMTLAQIGGVLEGLLAGLTNAEQNGIVHRDLKPENLMVTSDGRVKIADFGIAKAKKLVNTSALTATGSTLGTPTYMAPEQAMAQDVGPWTDLYSVGCITFELFTGKPPFHEAEAPMAILLKHINEPVPDLRSVDSSIDPAIAEWVDHLVEKDPQQRAGSASDAWEDFEEIVIRVLGPRWRRGARLGEIVAEDEPARPLTRRRSRRRASRPRRSSRASPGGSRAAPKGPSPPRGRRRPHPTRRRWRPRPRPRTRPPTPASRPSIPPSPRGRRPPPRSPTSARSPRTSSSSRASGRAASPRPSNPRRPGSENGPRRR